MAKTSDESVTQGSANIFADIGPNQPEEGLLKARIAENIADVVRRKRLSQYEFGRLV